MATDIGFTNSKETFKFRVCGIIQDGGKYLFIKSHSGDVYHTIGGHVEMGEPTNKAIIREFKEELKVDVEIQKLLCVNENIFINRENKLSHEIAYYFLLAPKGEISKEEKFVITEIDKGVIKEQVFEWFSLQDAKAFKLEPAFIRELLLNPINQTRFIITDDRK